MTNRLGDDYKLFVDNGSGTYTEIAGQKGLTLPSPQDLIEQTAKGDLYKLRQPGRPDRSITCSGGLRLPDANGLERVYTLFKTRVAGNFQVRVTPFSGSDVVFAANMWTSNFERDLTDQTDAAWSFQLTLNTAPTVDLL